MQFDIFGPALSEVETSVGPPLFLFSHSIAMSSSSGSMTMSQPIPSSPSTQSGVSITPPMSSISGFIVPTTTMNTSTFSLWGTSSIPSFPSI